MQVSQLAKRIANIYAWIKFKIIIEYYLPGLHATERLTPKEEVSDDKIMKEIDNFVNDDHEDLELNVHLRRLLDLQVILP